MSDGLQHYMHFFYPLEKGWIAIQEAKGCHGGSWAVPIAKDRTFFPKYHIDYIKHSLDGMPVTQVAIAEQIGPNKFGFKLDNFNLEFQKVRQTKSRRRYLGKLTHPDFLFEFAEVDFEPGILDAMFHETRYLLVGCSPFHYREVDDSKLIL
jgi:hypothetical protein